MADKPDLAEELLELWAEVADLLMAYQERIAEESFLASNQLSQRLRAMNRKITALRAANARRKKVGRQRTAGRSKKAASKARS